MVRENEEKPIVEGLTRIEERLTKVESDVAWLKHLYRSLDYRVWFLVVGLIIKY